MKNYKINIIYDVDVNKSIDNQLRQILTTCFPAQPIFREQRYFKEKPFCRWYYKDKDSIVAHVALHEKVLHTEIGELVIGGVAEVCVNPEYRGKGLAKQLLEHVHKYSANKGYKFTMLFGDTKVYSSSGYQSIKNDLKYFDHKSKNWKIEKNNDAMYKRLTNIDWPNGVININGPTF